MGKTKVLSYLSGLVMAVFFGISFLMTQNALKDMPPMVLMSYRFGIAAIALTILRCLHVIHINFKDKPLGGLILLSVFYPGISFFFETIGLQYVSSSQAGILVSIMPLFVTVLGMLILKEKPYKVQYLFIVASMIGVAITVIFAKNEGDEGTFVGIWLMLISLFGGALNNVLSRKYSKYFTPIEITYMMIWMGALIFTGIALIQGIYTPQILLAYKTPFCSLKMLWIVLELSIGTSVIAFFCMNYMLSKLKVANASLFTNLATVISILAGIIVMKEKLYWYQSVGGSLIVLSVWGTNYYETKVNHNKGRV